MDDRQVPILVGSGQITQRERDPRVALGAMDLTAAAARKAAEDAHGGEALLRALDAIVVLRSFSDTSWRFKSPFGGPKNPPKSIANRIDNTSAKRLIYTHPGGNMPQWCVNRLFEMVTRGEIGAAMICGGEALATQKAAERAKIALDWNEDAGGEPEPWGVATRGWSDMEDRHRMAGAIYAYPLFENGIRRHLKRSVPEHLAAVGELFAHFAGVAKANPLADRRQGFSAEQIATVGPDNPYIGFPYTKLMNSNAFIDQAAAVILTSVAKARELGIPRERWVYLHGCADAHDHWYISDRHNFHSSPAMRVVAREALAMAGTGIDGIDKFDLYSCFPSAVQIACAEMGIPPGRPARPDRNGRAALLRRSRQQLRHAFDRPDDGRGARQARQRGHGDGERQLRHQAVGRHLFDDAAEPAVRAEGPSDLSGADRQRQGAGGGRGRRWTRDGGDLHRDARSQGSVLRHRVRPSRRRTPLHRQYA